MWNTIWRVAPKWLAFYMNRKTIGLMTLIYGEDMADTSYIVQ